MDTYWFQHVSIAPGSNTIEDAHLTSKGLSALHTAEEGPHNLLSSLISCLLPHNLCSSKTECNAFSQTTRALSLPHGFAFCPNGVLPCPLSSEVRLVLQISPLLWNPPWFAHNRTHSFPHVVLFCTHIPYMTFYGNESVSPVDDIISHLLSSYYVPATP